MKNITLIILAGCALACCGCTTDSPIFANDATKAKAVDTVNPDGSPAGASNAEVARSIVNVQNSGASMGNEAAYGNPHASTGSSMNPYSH